ncbi:MAG: hypothetical protein QXE01_11575 [Sulfolobales archaeon]
MYIIVRESHRGLSRSSQYYFVIEENRLLHISHYAVSQKKIYEDLVEYIVDLNRLYNKKIVEISSTNSGILCIASIYPAEDLRLEFDQRRRETQGLSYLNSFELAYLTYDERMFLQTDWKQYYLSMIKELSKFLTELKNLNREFPYIILTSLIACQIESRANYPLSFLIPYSANARRKSLEALTKEIHQMWVATRLIVELAKFGRVRNTYINFEQSSYYAIASFYCKSEICSLWYEFDMNPHTMCGGMLWYKSASNTLRKFYEHAVAVLNKRGLKRAPLRPDIAILQGGMSCDEVVNEFKVKMIIECKNWEYEYWAKDVDNQVIPYKEIFQPDVIIIASMKKVPEHIKSLLNRHGIIIIDEVHPGGKGEKELLELIKTF